MKKREKKKSSLYSKESSTGLGDAVEPRERLGCAGEPWPRQSHSTRG